MFGESDQVAMFPFNLNLMVAQALDGLRFLSGLGGDNDLRRGGALGAKWSGGSPEERGDRSHRLGWRRCLFRQKARIWR